MADKDEYEADMKDYYQILRVEFDAEVGDIRASYGRLAKMYHLLLAEMPEAESYRERMSDIDEAYAVLSDPDRRVEYNRLLKAYKDQELEDEGPSKGEVVDAMAAMSDNEGLSNREIVDAMAVMPENGSERKGLKAGRREPRWRKVPLRIVLVAIVSIILVVVGGTSLALAKPEHALATPFRGVAATAAKASTGAVTLIEDIRGVVARYERNIVSTELQSMRVVEGLKVVPAVTVPTNDMACFPSLEYALFPDYLDKRSSQFRYTVDSKGIVSVDTSTATTDALLERIEQLLEQLGEEEE